MLHISLTDGRQFQLKTVSPVKLKNEGTYGNGSIDWEDEGLYLYDIATQIGIEGALAALVDGELMPLHTFVKKNCTLQYIMVDDEIGKAMINRTALFLTAYGIKSLNKSCKRIKGTIANEKLYYDFVVTSAAFSTTELQQAKDKIAEAIQANHPVNCRKLPYFTAKKELLNQGEHHLLAVIDENDDYGPVVMQVMDNFADLDQGLLLDDLSIFKAIALTQEVQNDFCRIYVTVEL